MNDVFALIPRKERISLRLWVFKFIDVVDIESFGVCVEGYRPSDETETVLRNWHSTAIEKRITSTLLHSHSGSVYELRGSIDRDLAFQFGYPGELIDMFANGFPEDWKSTLKEYFYVVKTTNPLNASHYFSVMARRRSSGLVRCQSRLSTGTVFNKSNRRSERLSILPAPGALPVPIEEEDEQKENSTSRSSLLTAKISFEDVGSVSVRRSPRIMEILSRSSKNGDTKRSFIADVSARPASSLEIENKPLADVGSKSDSCLRTSEVGDLPNDVDCGSDTEESIVFVPAVHSNKRDSIENVPRVEYPDSIGPEENDQDFSVGPAFEEPHVSIREINAQEESKVQDDDNHLAVVPVSTNVFKVPSRRPSRGEHDDATELTDWSIRFAPIGCDGPELNFPKFVLLGNKRGHYGQWRSSIVTRVVSAEILYTSSTKYRLVGEINITDSANAGFPKTFVASFLRGFPPNWRTRITDLYNYFFGNFHASTSQVLTTTNEPILLFSDESQEAVRSLHQEHETIPSRRKSIVADYNEKWGRDQQDKRTEEVSGSSKLAVVSPAVQSSLSSGVRRSRSGRCIHPPLAQWAGERVRYDGLGNAIGVEDVKTITVHSKRTSGTTALADYYGLSPADASLRQSEASTEPPRLAVDSGPKRIRTRRILASSDEENASPDKRSRSSDDAYVRYDNRQKLYPYEENRARENYRKHRHRTSSDESETERELRSERHLILKHTRELLKQQENLLKMEQRLASQERKWLERKKRKRLLREQEGKGFSRQAETFDRRPGHRCREESRQVARHMPSSHYQDNHRRKKVMNALDRRRLEEIWAQENEELTTSYYSDGDDDWQEPVRKRRKKVNRRVRETSSSESIPSDDEDSGDQMRGRASEGEFQKKDEARKKCWNAAEVQRLKLTIHAIRPQKDDDWEKVARAMGNERDLESYKEAAIKRLKWKPPPAESASPIKSVEPITARAGTIAFQHQTNEFTRKYMMGGGAHSEDFFQDNDATANISIGGLPDLNEFGADDSLLEVLNTPANAVPERKGANRRQFLAEPIDDDTPIRRRSSAVFMGTPQDSAQRERQDRYLHHLINKAGRRDVSKMNFSRAGNSIRFETTGAVMDSTKAHDYGGLQKDLKYAAKLTKKATRRDAVLVENSDEELELDEEDLSMDGVEDDGLL
ncbi:unnamed protein product [Cylicocyclus nassatus]|uniref:SANTA domain-containing protein n=1 Tax=Cylicocyclus nassatus TaxID=53992 RepID=A0AA36HDG9_CYLNA|nr:unnamed protein product [Cylicocyclus nassatus]